jgi:phosphatidylserine/phosphatidylglycerophosphate/cardiolipin synthase-like enzyme
MATLEQLEQKYFSSGVQHLRDTEVIPHLDAKDYYVALQEALDMLDSPDDVVYMSAWYFRPQMQLTPNAPMLAQVLHDKADIGMDVRVILWAGRFVVGGRNFDSSSWFDTGFAFAAEHVGNFVSNTQNNITMARHLQEFNPQGREKPPLVGSMLLDHGGGKMGCRHHKVVIVYHKATGDLRAFVGGLDIAPSRIGEPGHPEQNPWHDAAVELRGGAAMTVWDDFRTRWKEAVTLPNRFYRLEGQLTFFNNLETLIRPLVPPPPQVSLGVQTNYGVRVLRSYGPFREAPIGGPGEPWNTLPPGGIQEVLPTYIRAINSVTKNLDPNGPPSYIYIEDQYLNSKESRIEHDTLYASIAQAVNRDVKVVFIVPGRPDPDDPTTDENQHWAASLSGMLSAIQPDKWDNFVMYRIHNTFVHTKVVIINDEFLSIGTANFADRSMEGLDTEIQATIVTPGSLVRDFRVMLWADHLRVPVTPHVFSEIADLKKSLGIFDEDWGTDVDFDHTQDAFRLVAPLE